MPSNFGRTLLACLALGFFGTLGVAVLVGSPSSSPVPEPTPVTFIIGQTGQCVGDLSAPVIDPTFGARVAVRVETMGVFAGAKVSLVEPATQKVMTWGKLGEGPSASAPASKAGYQTTLDANLHPGRYELHLLRAGSLGKSSPTGCVLTAG